MTDDKNLGWSASEYAKLAGFDSDWRDSWWNQDYLELLARRLGFDEVGSVLDVGCGAGHWGQRLATLLSTEATVTGVDHESGFLEAAAKRAASLPQTFVYRAASAEALPFDDDTFDLVTCQTVLIHVADAKVALTEMLRVTKPGGLLVAAEPNNLVNAVVSLVALPRPPFEETLRRLAFEETCLRGKVALGQGDRAVGERLPLIFSELGLEDRRVYTNDNTGGLLPPYESANEQALVQMMRTELAEGYTRMGDRDTTRRQFIAGGGDETAFDALWELDQEAQRRALADVEASRFSSGGGFLMYVAAGRKPPFALSADLE